MKLTWPRSWSPSSRLSLRLKELKAPAVALAVPASRVGLKGRIWPGHWVPWGPDSRLKIWLDVLFCQGRVPGVELGGDRVDRAGRRGRHQAAFAGEEVELEVFEGGLGEVGEFGGELAGFGVGPDRADELGVDPEARGREKEAVLIAGLGFADVDGAFEPFGQGGGADREGADLGGVGAFAGAFGVEVGFGFRAFGLAVGGVGVDGEARRQDDGGGFDLRGLGGFGEELGRAKVDVQAGGRIGLVRWSGRPGGRV